MSHPPPSYSTQLTLLSRLIGVIYCLLLLGITKLYLLSWIFLSLLTHPTTLHQTKNHLDIKHFNVSTLLVINQFKLHLVKAYTRTHKEPQKACPALYNDRHRRHSNHKYRFSYPSRFRSKLSYGSKRKVYPTNYLHNLTAIWHDCSVEFKKCEKLFQANGYLMNDTHQF